MIDRLNSIYVDVLAVEAAIELIEDLAIENELLRIKQTESKNSCAKYMEEIDKLKATLAKCESVIPKELPGNYISFGKYYVEYATTFMPLYDDFTPHKKAWLLRCEEALKAIKEMEK